MCPPPNSVDLTGVVVSNKPAEDNDGDDEGDTDNNTGIDAHEKPLKSRIDGDMYHNGAIGQKELHQIHKDIAATVHPGPPVNFRSPIHGKLKADQWRSHIEFNIPVFLIHL